jgi:hypothetical protein
VILACFFFPFDSISSDVMPAWSGCKSDLYI